MRGDRALLQQAVANLLDNALKFSPEGSAVRVEATRTGGRITVEVADEGPGIPEADLGRAAERFFRGETARHTPGSGLGLALVQAVMQLHGGELSLGSAGAGARGLRATLALPSERNHPG